MKIGCQKLWESYTVKCQGAGWAEVMKHKEPIASFTQAVFKKPVKISSILAYIQWPVWLPICDKGHFWEILKDAHWDKRLRHVWIIRGRTHFFKKPELREVRKKIIWLNFARCCPVSQSVTTLCGADSVSSCWKEAVWLCLWSYVAPHYSGSGHVSNVHCSDKSHLKRGKSLAVKPS